jgi:hypothetical protein
MRQVTIFCAAAVMELALSGLAFAAESNVSEQAQLTVLCVTRSDTHCDESFPGTTKWSTERLLAGADQKPQMAVRADVEIPSRGVTMTWLMYPNDDKDLHARQFDEIHLELPVDLQPKSHWAAGFMTRMANSALRLGEPPLEESEKGGREMNLLEEDDGKGDGERLGDWSLKQSLNPSAERNFKLIEEHCWFWVQSVEFLKGGYMPVQSHFLISMEKGKAGARAFAEAFAAWSTTYAERSCALSLAPPSERQPPHDRIIAEARADIIDGVLGKR